MHYLALNRDLAYIFIACNVSHWKYYKKLIVYCNEASLDQNTLLLIPNTNWFWFLKKSLSAYYLTLRDMKALHGCKTCCLGTDISLRDLKPKKIYKGFSFS